MKNKYNYHHSLQAHLIEGIGNICEPLCSANFHGILYIYLQCIVPCSTETKTELVNHLLEICKTTFNTPFGQYRWNQMPFGT